MKRSLAIALAAMLAITGTAYAAFATGTYKGKTGQKQRITVVIGSSGMTSANYLANYRCKKGRRGRVSTARGISTSLGPSPFRGGAGRLNGNFASSNGLDKIHFVATVSGRRITGSFTETYQSKGKETCRSGLVKFSIRHV